MRKLAFASLAALAIAAVSVVNAVNPTPSGSPRQIGQAHHGRPVNFDRLAPPSHAYLYDGFGYCWDVDIRDNGGGNFTLAGAVYNTGWPCGGAADGSYQKATSVALTATNLCPDFCTFYSDNFSYSGSPGVNTGGSWTNNCGGSGTWSGTWYTGTCL